ncbi:MAG: hypothetical protein FWD06_08005 [Oscillospiraceae bacterium]|nr:hypothetical protein [Oscillospiraceae bacterium]
MKKFFISHFETLWHTIIIIGTFVIAFQVAFMDWPNDFLLIGLSLTSILFVVVLLVQLNRQVNLRRVLHLIHSILAAIYLMQVYQSGPLILSREGGTLIILILALFVSTIIWLIRSVPAGKDEPPAEEENHDGEC